MKWLAASVCLVFMVGAVGAQANENSNLPEPGTTPGSLLFGLEQAQESVSLALTFNPEKKAEKRLQIAQERLAEAQKLTENNDSRNAEKAVQMHTKAMERANQAVQRVPEERRQNISQKLNNTRNQSISVLQDLKQRLPESAMKGINTAIEAHQNKGVGNKPANPGQNNSSQNRTQGNNTDNPSNSEVDQEQPPRPSGYVAKGRVVED